MQREPSEESLVSDRAAYMAKYRAEHPDVYERHKLGAAARDAALERLANRYRPLFEALVNEERERRGLPPVGYLPRGRPPKSAGTEATT